MRARPMGYLLAAFLVAGPVALGSAASAVAPAPWRRLPRAPIAGRISASVVWTGREMIVWGGVGGHVPMRSDGAAYDPATRIWRRIVNAPPGITGGGGLAAWTGRTMLVWASNSPTGPAGAAAYDPRTNSWRRLPSGPLGSREGDASVWTGRELLIFGGHSGDSIATPTAAALEPRAGSWRTLRALNAVKGLIADGAVWNGREAFVSGSLFAHKKSTPILIAYNPTTGTLRRISLSGVPASSRQGSGLEPIAWTGRRIVFSTSADPLFSSTTILLYDPSTDVWTKARPAPCSLPAKSYTQIAWVGTGLVAACGRTGLQIYSPRSNSWRTLAPGAGPLNSKGWSAIAWTGRDLIVWSGTVRLPHNPTPPSGASLTLAR
jgi:hypothetical protein